LYMGYFETRESAEKWLVTLRRIYPSAFVCATPDAQTLSDSQIVSLLDQPPSTSSQQAKPASLPQTQRTHSPPAARAAIAPREASAPRVDKRRSEPSLEDTIADLKVDTLAFNSEEDSLNTTGVRHLRIEVQSEPRSRSEKRSGSRKS